MRQEYPNPNLVTDTTYKNKVNEIRKEDLSRWRNLSETYIQGRTVRIATPSSATDVAATDKEGDEFTDGGYVYKLVDVSGTLKWGRIAIDTSW